MNTANPGSVHPPPGAARPDGTAPVSALKVLVVGFQPNERRLLDGIVMLSQRRNPRLSLVKPTEAAQADAVLIDALDRQSLAWAKGQAWLNDRAVVWVDSTSTDHPPGHTVVKRPVQWPGLPILLARALEEHAIAHSGRADFGNTDFAESFAISTAELVKKAPTTDRVLVVDDSLAVRNHLMSLLGGYGIAVTAVESGDAALAAVGQADYKVVLMDVLMPGMDGYETCKRIKAARRNQKALPVVMLTSKSSPFDRIRGKMAGCDAYLTKPVDPKALHETLAHFIHLKKQAAEPGLPMSRMQFGAT